MIIKRWYSVLMVVSIIGLLPLAACSSPTTDTTTPEGSNMSLEQQATEWVNLLVAENFDQAVESFDNTMSGLLPASKLRDTWTALITQAGAFQNIIGTRTEKLGAYDVVYVTCSFANMNFDVQLSYDAEEKIAGLYFQPSTQASYSPPDYADPALFTETEVTVGAGQWSLPATLTMPKREGPFPAVILVHGSGPNDRDETVGANKPFKDLAWGLASRNIAVLRYEKRTKQYPQEITAMLDTLTVQDETIDDVLAAVDLLSRTTGINTERIYVLGHSLGGLLAPRIASQDSRLAGLIIIAGPTRNLEDLILEQTNYLASLDGTIDENEAAQIEQVEQLIKKIKDLNFAPGEVVMGAGKAYWQDLAAYDDVATAQNLTLPMLILQGERDFQVTMEDFNGWVEGLEGNSNVTSKSYPGLNHLFIYGTGKSSPAEYQQPGNISRDVIEDIAAWIESQL